mgnify:CR=1 FL=1
MKTILNIILSLLLITFTSNVNASSEKLTIGLDWFINPDHAPLIIAKKRNFFKDLNLDVEMIEPADPNVFVFPALRITKRSPNPASKITSTGTLESEQASKAT